MKLTIALIENGSRGVPEISANLSTLADHSIDSKQHGVA